MVDDRNGDSVEASKSSNLVDDRSSENDEKQNQIDLEGYTTASPETLATLATSISSDPGGNWYQENAENKNQIDMEGSKDSSKGESNSVWSAFKRQSAGVISEYKRKTAYLSKSKKRKLKSEIARKKRHKRNHNFGRGI